MQTIEDVLHRNSTHLYSMLDLIISQDWFQVEAEFYFDIEAGLSKEDFKVKLLETLDCLLEVKDV